MPLSDEVSSALEIQKIYIDMLLMVQNSLEEKIKRLEKNNVELTVSLQFTHKKVDDLKNDNNEHKRETEALKKEITDLKKNECKDEIIKINSRLDYQEHYSRRNNLRIDGMMETQRLLRDDLRMGVVQLERAHRVGVAAGRPASQASHCCGTFLPLL